MGRHGVTSGAVGVSYVVVSFQRADSDPMMHLAVSISWEDYNGMITWWARAL